MEEILYYACGEAVEQVAQRNCECPISVGIQGPSKRVFAQPGLVAGIPGHGMGVGTR